MRRPTAVWGLVVILGLGALGGLVAGRVMPLFGQAEAPQLVDVYPLVGMVAPGREVPLKVQVRFPAPAGEGEAGAAPGATAASTPPLTLRVRFTRLFEEIGATTVEVAGEETTFTWRVPADPPEAGYGVEVELVGPDGRVLGRRATAVDVGTDWTRKPRYGFVCDFGPDQVGRRDRFETMARFHLNGLQFYDWMYRHSEYLPPAEEYRDPLGRPMSLAAVRDKIRLAREHGMASMAYVAVYGAPVDFYLQHPDWALYTWDGTPATLGEDFLVIMNLERDSPWRAHMLSEYRKVMTALAFDGLHLDQYGDPKFALAYPPEEGRMVDVALELPSFINEAKDAVETARPGGKVIFNNVGNWPTRDTASSKVDAVYIEVWPPYRHFQHLKELIDEARAESEGKAVVLVAYIPPEFEPSVLLTDAVIFACGGFHLELGEGAGMLRGPYFPDYQALSPELEADLRRYYDFAVRYQELLYSADLEERDLSHGGVEVEGVRTGDKGYFNVVWAMVRENPRYQVTHLINLLGLQSAEWNAPRREPPDPLGSVRVRIASPVEPVRVFVLSPDRDAARTGAGAGAQAVPFSYEDGVVTLTLPGLEYWDMVVFEKPGPPPGGSAGRD
ncbi:MAG TPA: hypothetical protein DGR79_01275 [Clostridiales bacterium]|nr:hypothetical protein [Clostridiales bacterium]